MKQLLTAACMAAVLSSAASAQEHKGDQHKMGKDKMGKPITVTGCVAAASDANHFTLTDAVMTGEKTGKSYDLMGGDLKAHVGHKVAVTGTLGAMTMSGKDKMAMGKDKMPMEKGEHGMAKGKTSATEPHSMLHVTSVKMIAATCR
jgi:opacity protein-like surface antigen